MSELTSTLCFYLFLHNTNVISDERMVRSLRRKGNWLNSTELESIGLILQRFTSNQIEKENWRTDTGTVWAVLAEEIRRNTKANRKLFHTWWNKDRHHIKSNQKEQQKGNPNDGKLMGSAHQKLPTITRPLSVKGAINLQDKESDPLEWGMLLSNLGLAQRRLGAASGDLEILRVARRSFAACEGIVFRKKAGFDWAMLQWNIADLGWRGFN